MQAAKLSKGIFDISLGRVTQVWRQARKLKQVPADTAIQRASKQSGMRWIQYQCSANQIRFSKPELLLDLGGIAKGFVAQLVVDRLKSWGVVHALADAGGDMAATEAPPGKKGWQIAINRPEEKEALLENLLLIKNKAVATSGDSFQVLEADNLRYSHIIDPHTGKGITNGKNVTVIAADGATADWLATACSILETDAALALAKKCGAELLITQLISGQIVYAQTPGFWK
jgi:thiamine biosynthesis lipoprotein